ncbi:hypothetical protein CONPUDRAFT_166125 [Coniophora puteana RWD-64-598 SS2]|uniref:Uncharacterized protein n=1 Tax=Coniophora puteana (strain RWD-64-598) TaxID=741705 RepID=A0A5M3MNB9_CONPW|nr:uncharacterized protein CONPUDRAFT_166125 [Coniophora puteana RWD-64-598 SS2]EIW80668.1 hypothetical protein CONPUDRAFT_166125 [Coniophora puteana RWD-64-598 SS2]
MATLRPEFVASLVLIASLVAVFGSSRAIAWLERICWMIALLAWSWVWAAYQRRTELRAGVKTGYDRDGEADSSSSTSRTELIRELGQLRRSVTMLCGDLERTRGELRDEIDKHARAAERCIALQRSVDVSKAQQQDYTQTIERHHALYEALARRHKRADQLVHELFECITYLEAQLEDQTGFPLHDLFTPPSLCSDGSSKTLRHIHEPYLRMLSMATDQPLQRAVLPMNPSARCCDYFE